MAASGSEREAEGEGVTDVDGRVDGVVVVGAGVVTDVVDGSKKETAVVVVAGRTVGVGPACSATLLHCEA